MATIQVVFDKELLRAANRAAKRAKVNRSALIREAVRHHLRQVETRELERRDREGYRKYPDTLDDAVRWERVAAWPED